MTKTISQAAAVKAISEKVNGSALNITSAAIGAHKAAGKLSTQVRALMQSPAPVVEATLSQAFAMLAERVKPDVWPTIANSIATNVRIIVKGLPDETRPQVCYIALDRGACTANVVVMAKATVAQLEKRLGHDQKALNAAKEKLFGKPAAQPLHNPEQPPQVAGSNDKHAPLGGVLGALIEQTKGLRTGDLMELVKRLQAEIEAREAARLAEEETKGKVTAKGKPNAKSRGESQRVAKNQPAKPSAASAAPTAPTVEAKPTAQPAKTRRSTTKPEAAPVCTPTAAAAA